MACNQPAPVIRNHVFTPSRFPSQIFTIDVSRDTSLHTAKGAVIRIPAGSIDASQDSRIQLEVKEFYSMTDIVKAGLLTTSNGQALSSGGMIFIQPTDTSKASIRKPFYVSIPAPFYEPHMRLYEGEAKDGMLVNWNASQHELLPGMPGTASADSGITPAMLDKGRILFFNNCNSCHGIAKDLTGPALAWSYTKFKALDPDFPELLYRITRNNQEVLASGNLYFNYQFELWNKTPMNVFPNLTREEMDVLYTYIENESKRNKIPINTMTGLDSCIFNLEKAGYKGYLTGDPENGLLIKHKDDNSISIPPPASHLLPLAKMDEAGNHSDSSIPSGNDFKVRETRYYLPVYQWGWLNVDALTGDLTGSRDISVQATIEGVPESANVQVNLFIPGLRVNIEATPDDDGRFHFKSFKSVTGYKSYVMVTTDKPESFHFGMTDFILSDQQEIQVKLKPSSIEQAERILDKITGKKRNLPVQDLDTGADTAFAGYAYDRSELSPEVAFDSMVPPAYNAVTVKIGGMKEKTRYLPGKGTRILLRELKDTMLCNCLTKYPLPKP